MMLVVAAVPTWVIDVGTVASASAAVLGVCLLVWRIVVGPPAKRYIEDVVTSKLADAVSTGVERAISPVVERVATIEGKLDGFGREQADLHGELRKHMQAEDDEKKGAR